MSQREEPGEHLTRLSVLLLSDDAEFARTVAARWQVERQVPEITLASSDLWNRKSDARYDLAIAGFIAPGRPSILWELNAWPARPVIYVADNGESVAELRTEHPHVLVMTRQEGWTSNLILLASEVLRRLEALGRAHRAERKAVDSLNHAILGRYMLEMRPNINNALTSVLGNADLLLLERCGGANEAREQIRTIHSMALRLNEIMQRFSSLDSEMRAGEKTSQTETEGLDIRLVTEF